MPRNSPTFDVVAAVLADGPLHEDDVVAALGLDQDEDETWDVIVDLLDDPRIVELRDGRMALASTLLEGVVARHRVSADEVAARTIAPGLDALLHFAAAPSPHQVHLGDEVVDLTLWVDDDGPDLDRGPALPLPDGWAPELAGGDLVALVLREDVVHLVTEDDPQLRAAPSDIDDAADLRDALSMVAEDHAPTLTLLGEPGGRASEHWVLSLDEVASLLLADHGPVFRGLGAPLVEALAESGLVCLDGMVGGPAVTDGQLGLYAMGRDLLGRRADEDPEASFIAEAVGLTWAALLGARDLGDELASGLEGVLLEALAIPMAVEAIVDNLRSVDDERLEAIATRADELHELDAASPGPAWLAAEARLAQADPHGALDRLATSIGRGASPPDGEWGGAWDTLGHLHAVAGDVSQAMRVFERMGEDGVVARLREWRPTPPTGVGRNERCPCGSGRKFKQCCLVHPTSLDLDDRVPPLWWKLQAWVVRYHGDHVPQPDLELIDREPALAAVWMLGFDAHLVEDEAMAEVVAEVGDLLPDDERALVDQWLLRSRSLWEVVELDPAGGCWLRDLMGGDDVLVTGNPPTDATAGDLLLAMVVPGLEGEHVVGHVLGVPFGARDRVLAVLSDDPDGDDIVDLASDLLRPPQPITSDGDPIVFHEARWQVPDLDGAAAALDLVAHRSGEAPEWSDGGVGESIRWSLRVEDDHLVGSAMSDVRWEELEAVLTEALPDAALVDHEVTDGDAMMAAARTRAARPLTSVDDLPGVGEGSDAADPAMAEVLERVTRQKEVEWCDEHIPALGGITPREALADPTRREDLIALLRSFRTPAIKAGGGFDADRIATLLGIADEL